LPDASSATDTDLVGPVGDLAGVERHGPARREACTARIDELIAVGVARQYVLAARAATDDVGVDD
jgi:hypothetical protein